MRVTILFALGSLCGCTPYVLSPPGRSFPLESSKALYERETGIQVEGGGGTDGPNVGLPGFNVRVRHGIVDQNLDASFEFGFQRIQTGEEQYLASSDRNIFTGRLGMKYAIIDHVAVTAGVAAGTWGGGPFLSPDLSMIFAWENPYCVPFIDGGGYTSHPLRADVVVITDSDPTNLFEDEGLIAAPVLTYGWTAGFGLRIPLRHIDDGSQTPPAILLGTRFRGAYWDPAYNDLGRNENVYWYGSVGFEYVINPDVIRARRN